MFSVCTFLKKGNARPYLGNPPPPPDGVTNIGNNKQERLFLVPF